MIVLLGVFPYYSKSGNSTQPRNFLLFSPSLSRNLIQFPSVSPSILKRFFKTQKTKINVTATTQHLDLSETVLFLISEETEHPPCSLLQFCFPISQPRGGLSSMQCAPSAQCFALETQRHSWMLPWSAWYQAICILCSKPCLSLDC